MPPIGFSCALKGSCCQQRGPAASTATTTDTLVPKTQTTSPTTLRFSAFFAEVVCTLGTTQPQTVISPPPNGGNGGIRDPTRRRHADSQPLMLQNPTATGVEGTGGTAGPGPGTRGRRGLARQHTDTPTDWRPPRGLRGLAGQRADAPSEARGADGERAGRPRDGRRSVGATSPSHTPRRHNKTARPQWGRAAAAVALGFEPRVAVTPHSISSAAPSAARTRYLTRILYYTLPLRAQIDRAGWEQGHTAAWEQGHTATRSQAAHTAHETGATSKFRSIKNEIK